MLFKSKPQVLIHLRRDSLELYGKSAQKLEFPAELVQNLEVTDKDVLYKLSAQLAQKVSPSNRKALFLLDSSVIFQKAFPAADKDVAAKMADFISKVPFEPANIATISIQAKDQRVLVATNKELYIPIAKAFIDLGYKLIAIAPAAVCGLTVGNTTAPEILSKSNLAEQANFLEV